MGITILFLLVLASCVAFGVASKSAGLVLAAGASEVFGIIIGAVSAGWVGAFVGGGIVTTIFIGPAWYMHDQRHPRIPPVGPYIDKAHQLGEDARQRISRGW